MLLNLCNSRCVLLLTFSLFAINLSSYSQTNSWQTSSTNIYYTYPGGNVGIGTTTPWSALDIRTNGSAANGYYGINVQNPSTSAYATVNINLGSGSTSGSIISAQRNNLGNGSYLFFQTTDATGTSQNRMLITDNGSVGIGTLAPGSNKLAVEGTIGARKVVVTLTNPFPDYVFNKDYQLPSFKEIENYILANHHLSELPSADSVAKNGLDLGSNQSVLVKKIEELTLYAINQNKRLESQDQEIKRLKEENKKIEQQQQMLGMLEAQVQELILSKQKEDKNSPKK